MLPKKIILICILLLGILVLSVYIFSNKHEKYKKQEHLREHLENVTNVFDDNGIEYWIDYGTLLGCVRGGDIIPWDNDTDTSACIEQLPKLLTLKSTFKNMGYDLVHIDVPALNYIKIHDPIRKVHTDVALRVTQNGKLVDPANTTKGTEEQTIDDSDVFPIHKNGGKIGNKTYPVPAKTWKVLSKYYGYDCMHRKSSKHVGSA
jgi:hypothetical protein